MENKNIRLESLKKTLILLKSWITDNIASSERMNAVLAKIDELVSEIARIEGLVATEQEVRAGADEAIEETVGEVKTTADTAKTTADGVRRDLDTLIGSEQVEGVIDTFKEIEKFLEGITTEKTLAGMLAKIQSDLEAKITAGDTANAEDITAVRSSLANYVLKTAFDALSAAVANKAEQSALAAVLEQVLNNTTAILGANTKIAQNATAIENANGKILDNTNAIEELKRKPSLTFSYNFPWDDVTLMVAGEVEDDGTTLVIDGEVSEDGKTLIID